MRRKREEESLLLQTFGSGDSPERSAAVAPPPLLYRNRAQRRMRFKHAVCHRSSAARSVGAQVVGPGQEGFAVRVAVRNPGAGIACGCWAIVGQIEVVQANIRDTPI